MEVETLLKEGSSRKIICAVADSGDYDMLVIGRHTEGEFRNLLFGYVSNFVIHHVKCPLLVI
jgi:nucleotide-binding universal stress UspA family protein